VTHASLPHPFPVEQQLSDLGISSLKMVNLMLAVEVEFDIAHSAGGHHARRISIRWRRSRRWWCERCRHVSCPIDKARSRGAARRGAAGGIFVGQGKANTRRAH